MKNPDPETLNLTNEELMAWRDRLRLVLTTEDFNILHSLLTTYLYIRQALSAARVSIARLKRLFGAPRTEKKEDVLPKAPDQGQGNTDTPGGRKKKDGPKPKGHGKNGVAAYLAAQRVPVCHENFYPGCPCPDENCDGKVYRLKVPGKVLRITGQSPLKATVYEPERWRCNLCEEIFWAQLPVAAGEDKYDASAVAMIAILHFANGFAFHRLEQHQASLGIPLPASDQSENLSAAYQKLLPVFKELIRCAAQCEILHNDDTGMKILDLLVLIKKSRDSEGSSSKNKKKRTGIHTTGIVAIAVAYQIALYFTGRKHAGENLADVLQHRDTSLPAPIHMSDGLDHNAPGNVRVKSSKCLTHYPRVSPFFHS